MPDTALFWVLAALATFFVGASKGGVPGVAALAVPLLATVMSPVVAAGLLLPLYILSDLYGLWLYRREYDPGTTRLMVFAGAIGIAIGWATASVNNDALVRLVVGLVGLWYVADIALKRRRARVAPAQEPSIARGMPWGILAGFTSFVAHAGGTPFQMYVLPLRLSKMAFAGTATITFAFINLMKLPPYWLLGQVNATSLTACLYLSPMAILGAWSGYKLITVMNEDVFYRIVEIALLAVSLKLLWDAGRALL